MWICGFLHKVCITAVDACHPTPGAESFGYGRNADFLPLKIVCVVHIATHRSKASGVTILLLRICGFPQFANLQFSRFSFLSWQNDRCSYRLP